MMDPLDSENWDRESRMKSLFDPEHVTEWLKYAPGEFLALMIMEIRQEKEIISAWSKLLDENPEFRELTFRVHDHEFPSTWFTQTVLRSARIIERLLDTAAAYREETKK